MDTCSNIVEIEKAFNFKLPCDYRAFLEVHEEDVLDPLEINALVAWQRGPVASIDRLYCSASILKHDASGASCDLENRMLIIGNDVAGGYLYLSWAVDSFGQIFFREPYYDRTFYLVAQNFSDFVERSRPMAFGD
jgi:hypothetical protein